MNITDYNQPHNWLKIDEKDYPVDIFFLYATAYIKQSPADPIICQVDHKEMRAAAKFSYHKNATVFKPVGNMFAPYYRQTDAPSCLKMTAEEREKLLDSGPVEDAMAAFDYYLKHYNKGKPYILAGHSQGSSVLLQMISKYSRDKPQAYKRMISAYLIGCSITPEYLEQYPHLKFAQGSDDTGIIISYNTEAPNPQGPNPVLLPGALAINPINWRRDETPATKEESLGARVQVDNGFKKIAHLADARLDLNKGVVICSTVGLDNPYCDVDIFAPGIYHVADYTFYYYDLRQNAIDRIKAYFKANP